MTVRRWRRAAAALLGVLALGALAGFGGCGGGGDDWDDDAIIAYVGDVEITEAEVDAVAEDLRAEIGAEIESELDRRAAEGELTDEELAEYEDKRYSQLRDQVAVTRTRVIEMRILTTAATSYAQDEGIAVPDPPIEMQADELGLSPESAYVQVVAGFFAVMSQLQAVAAPEPPTEQDQREVHTHMVEDGMTTTTFEEAQEVLNEEVLGEAVGMRNLLADILERADVRVNPEYDLVYRVPVRLGELGETWLGLPLG
jgi:hypothetical protein